MVPAKKLLVFSGLSAVYFTVLFTGVLRSVSSPLVGVLVELFTIPMIVAQVAIVGYAAYQVVYRKAVSAAGLVISAAIAFIILICVFIVE